MNTKPHVVQVITRFIHGGAQEVTLLIVHRLLKEGYEVTLAHGPGDESLLKRLPRENPHFHDFYVPEFRRRILPHWDFLAFLRIYRYLKKHRVQLVHTHTSKAGILGRWAAKLAGVPVIIHSPRGSIYHETYFSEPVLKFFAWLERQVSRFTHKIITLNESEKADYIRYKIAPPSKFTTIYSGIEVKRYLHPAWSSVQGRQSLGISEGIPLIGYIARMTPEKGHSLCLKAFKRVLQRFPESKLVFIGNGPLEADIRSETKALGLDSNVIFAGMKSDVENYYPMFDCCVQTSLWDGLPRAMVEALVAKRPMVATAVGGISELLIHEKTGFVVPPKDEKAIAERVCQLLENPELAKQFGERASKHMQEVFNVDVSVEKLFSLYEAMIMKETRGSH